MKRRNRKARRVIATNFLERLKKGRQEEDYLNEIVNTLNHCDTEWRRRKVVNAVVCASHRSQLDLIKYVFLSSANLGGEDFEYLNESIEIRYDRREFNYKEKRDSYTQSR